MSRPPAPPARQTGWRPAGSTVFIVLGVLAYLLLRQLPPDNSLQRVKTAGVLTACVPRNLPPFISVQGGSGPGDQGTGLEAKLLGRAAQGIGVPLAWNIQAAWGTSPDPVDWGVRPESCDVLAGGIIVNEETQGMMQLLPYKRSGWALLTLHQQPRQLAVLTNHWGLNAGDAFDWADTRRLPYLGFDSATQALRALQAGQQDSALGLSDEVQWLSTQLPGSQVHAVPELPEETLALGMWKNNITLKRVLTATIHPP